jgi:hypothetical protein
MRIASVGVLLPIFSFVLSVIRAKATLANASTGIACCSFAWSAA